VLVVTSHRRESWGHDLENICRALRDLVAYFRPRHRVSGPLNPNVREPVNRMLAGVERIHLISPLDYLAFVTSCGGHTSS